jgi:maltose alpha-D-glucosyltransferase/alpha-amylase
MQWTPDRNAGFSRANPQKVYLPVIIDPEYHFEAVNVELQDRNPSSLLWWMRRVISVRKKFKAFSRGSCEFLPSHNHRVLSFIRRYEDEIILVVVNLSRYSQFVEIDLSEYTDMIPREVFSYNDFPRIKGDEYQITLGPHSHYWFLLRPAEDEEPAEFKPPTARLSALPEKQLDAEVRECLETRVLPRYLVRSRWFGGKGRKIQDVTIVESVHVLRNDMPGFLLIIEVGYNEGAPEHYQIPVAFARRDKAKRVAREHPQSVLCNLKLENDNAVLFDVTHDPAFHRMLFDMMARRRRLKAERGEMTGTSSRSLKRELDDDRPVPESKLLGAEQSNTSIRYGDDLILKLYRRLEDGVNPDAEIGRLLSQKRRFAHVPAYKGGLAYRFSRGRQFDLGLMQEYVVNQGDAWTYVLGHVGQYLEQVLTRRQELPEPPEIQPLQIALEPDLNYRPVADLVGKYHSEMLELLGQRTAEMHLALAGAGDNPAFSPEGFSQLYQRSVYQSMRNLVRAVLRTLEKSQPRFDASLKEASAAILDRRDLILNHIRGLTARKIPAQKIRIHGDYHLGQVLFTGGDFVIIDFEGEPARPLSERRLKRSPLRDVAGMVRSFHYAIHTGMKQNPSVRNGDRAYLMPWTQAWYHYAAGRFLQTYLATVADSGLLPKKTEDANLLFEAFLLEKAVYELGYELNNRPDWVSIPINGLNSILEHLDRN